MRWVEIMHDSESLTPRPLASTLWESYGAVGNNVLILSRVSGSKRNLFIYT